MRNLIIFDCFGVVLGEIAPVWFSAKFGRTIGEKLKNKYFAAGDSGEKDIDQIIDEIHSELGISRETIIEEWTNLLVVNEFALECIALLRKNNVVAMLSNAPSGLFEKILMKQHIFDCFDKVFISGDMKVAKPAEEAYLQCINAFDEKFSKIYMVDDNIKNLCGLEKLKIVPILYKNNNDLEKLCRSLA